MKNKKGFIFYFDILGYRSLLYNNTKQENIKVAQLLENITKLYSNLDVNLKIGNKFNKNKLFKRYFSDNFLFLYEIEKNDNQGLSIIQELAAKIQYQFLCAGLLTRGSITYGELFYTNDIVFGIDLIRVVELEENHRMPSIIIDSKLKNVFMKNKIDYKDEITLFDILTKNDIEYNKCVNGIKKYLDNLNKKYVDNKIIDKIKWFINELNLFFGENKFINFNLVCDYKYSLKENRTTKK